MARAALVLACLAMLSACALAQMRYVEVMVKWDNNEAQTRKADAVVQRMLADKLCRVPRTAVRTLRILKKGSVVNTETWGYYACGVGATPAQLGTIISNCNNKRLQKNFDDEVQDKTMPDQEMEGIMCTLK